MIKLADNRRIIALSVAAALLGACQTVKLPKIEDIMKSPEFRDDAAKISNDYPDASEAPIEPTDIRSAEQWDKDVRALQAIQTKPETESSVPAFTASQADARYEALKAKAQAYKKDDPASGPVQGFPEYEPRR